MISGSVLAAFVWIGFLGGSLLVVLARLRRPDRRRTTVNGFLVFLIVVSFAPGLTRRQLWPFDSWPMFAHLLEREANVRVLLGVDGEGHEFPVDFRAWQPFSPEELHSWLGTVFPQLEPEAQDSAASYLLRKANLGRERALAGESIGGLDRFLGPLWAPTHFLHRAIWNVFDSVPPHPFVEFRISVDFWNVRLGRGEPGLVDRRIQYRYPRPE